MLNFKFPVTMATVGRLKFAKNHYFALFYSSKQTEFKVLQLLNGLRQSKRLFSVGNTLRYDRPEVNFSLSHVQTFLGDEGTAASLQTRYRRGYIPFLATPWCTFLIEKNRKVITFLLLFLEQKQCLGPK
jgi:hypothetical protein